MSTKTLTSARCIFRKNGKPIALVEGLTVTKTFLRGEVHPSGRLTALERPITALRVNGNMERSLPVGDDQDPYSAGLVPSTAGTPEDAVTKAVEGDGDNIDVYDIPLKKTVAKIVHFYPDSVGLNIPRMATATAPITFTADDLWFEGEL